MHAREKIVSRKSNEARPVNGVNEIEKSEMLEWDGHLLQAGLEQPSSAGHLDTRRHGAHSERSVNTLRGSINRRHLPSTLGVVLVNSELIRIFVVSFAIVALSQSSY